MSNILIINGPNLNLLGEREQSQYGKEDYKFLEEICFKRSKELKISLKIEQSNLEGEIVDLIQKSRNDQDGVIINAGGYTHTSVALTDTVAAIETPVIEVHITNIYSREDFRRHSLLSINCKAVVCGLGLDSYKAALAVL